VNLAFDPLPKLAHARSFGLAILENRLDAPVVWKALSKGAFLIPRLLCDRPHNSRYVALMKMRFQISKRAILEALSSVEHHITGVGWRDTFLLA
jgi:hypothetical protein